MQNDIFFIILIIIALIFFFLRSVLIIVNIYGVSMLPTLIQGDRVLAIRYFPFGWLRRRQIIITRLPDADLLRSIMGAESYTVMQTRQPLHIKRIVGLPGDKIITSLTELREEMRPILASYYGDDGQRVWQVPPSSVFVRGDAPGLDSAIYGPVPSDHIIGVVIFVFKRSLAEKTTKS